MGQTESAEKPWLSAPERSELLENMEPDTEPLFVNSSRKWRFRNTSVINLHSVVQPRSREPLSVSGNVPELTKRWLVALGSRTPRTTRWSTWVFGVYVKLSNHKF